MKRSDVYLGAHVEPSAAYLADLDKSTAVKPADVLAKALDTLDLLAERVADLESRISKAEAFERGQRRG